MMNGKNVALTIATVGDASWFERHTDRRLRIRNMVPASSTTSLATRPSV